VRCPACGSDNRDRARFCEQCGARLEAACAACGARLGPGARFCGECGAPVAGAGGAPTAGAPGAGQDLRGAAPRAYTPAHLAERILSERAALAGERKQVTVLFADVSGFTGLAERLDPEEVHALINRAFELMLAEIHRYEGTVNQFLGDGLMALFGAPVAHEDHAQRAAHAALAMHEALERYRRELARERGVDFRVRLGLNTGRVVVGAIGDNLRMDYTAVGDTTNTAARMQQLAEPGQIVLAEATHRLIAPYFETRALGSVKVKNRARPVAAWALVGARGGVSRLDARAARGLSPFVSRDDALAALERAWTAARGGRGQAAFVVGDPGLGKSRLLLEFRQRAGPATWLQGECVSFGQSIPYLPIVEMLRRNFGIEGADPEPEVVARIERGLAFMGEEGRAVAPFLRYLLAVDPGDPTVAALDPVLRRSRIVEAIRRLAAEGSRRRPVVLVVEDAHWIDPASEDYLKTFVDDLPGMAVLLVVTYRPAYAQPFGDRTYFWRIALQPVEEDAAARIVRATLGVDDLPADLAREIARKAEGNPFFIEEIGRTLVETGALRSESGRVLLAQPAATITVPETVQDVIAARLDRLAEPQKRTVQTASVIGREFGLALLRRVSDLHDRLEQSLADLKRIELIYEKFGAGNLAYVFRHALTQDVAYASLLHAERRRLHALIGAAIEEVYAGRLEEHVEELAWHFRHGEVWDKVVRYAREAAERAVALCVDDRGVEYYETALDALGRLPESIEGHGDERFGLSGLPATGALALAADALAELGDVGGAFALLERAEGVVARAGHLYSEMVLVAVRGHVLVRAGRATEAIAVLEPAEATCRDKKFVGQLINVLRNLAEAYVEAGRPADAVRAAQESIDLQVQAGVSVIRGHMHTALALAWTRLGDLARAEATLRTGLDFAVRQGERATEGWLHAAAAEVALARGDRAGAEHALDAAQEIAEELGMRPLVERCRARLGRLG
jgi:class 3 adenylate cyclase/tetratricopeptide (TPR) repeat protein